MRATESIVIVCTSDRRATELAAKIHSRGHLWALTEIVVNGGEVIVTTKEPGLTVTTGSTGRRARPRKNAVRAAKRTE